MYETDTLSRVCQDCYCNKLVISRNTGTLVVILTCLTGYDESRYTPVRIIHTQAGTHTQARTHTQTDQLIYARIHAPIGILHIGIMHSLDKAH